jgi:hypothetical protein
MNLIKQHDHYTGVLGTIKGHSKMYSFVTQHYVTDLRECAIGMLTAGMSTKAVARELNVNLCTVSCLQIRFREFGSTSNRPPNRRPRVWRCVGELVC